MNKLFSVVLVAFIAISTPSHALVIETHDLEVINQELQTLDDECLVVFDVDDTLIMTEDQILRANSGWFDSKHPIITEFWQAAKERNKDRDTLVSKIFLKGKRRLIDERILNVIDTLNRNNVNTIALTALPAGPLGLIPRLDDWRIDNMLSLGIDFHPSAPHPDEIAFTELEKDGLTPVYKRGILFSSRQPKGKVLWAFLNRIQWKPKKVIFIDDYLSFIKTVEEELEAAQIEHISFHYTGATHHFPVVIDEEVARLQSDHLLEHEEWLSDTEAKNKLSPVRD